MLLHSISLIYVPFTFEKPSNAMDTRVYRENMFFKKKISATHNASAWGLVRRDPDPKRFLILTKFNGSSSNFRFDHFYIEDFHSVQKSEGHLWVQTVSSRHNAGELVKALFVEVL